MTTSDFLSSLRERDVRLWVEDGRLRCDAPPGVLDDGLRAQLAARKPELISLIAKAKATLEFPRSVVPLKPSGDLPPLFARPGHNGDVFCYRALAGHLDPHQPLYGVEPKGLDGNPVAGTVQEMAKYEVGQIRAVQAEGPYFIAGFCAGGAIAFESARQLARSGEEVARVMLFGSPFPDVYREARIVTQVRSLDYRLRRHAPALASGSPADRVEYLRGRVRSRRTEAAKRGDPSLANRRRIEAATIAAVKRYEPEYYDGRVDVFLPSHAARCSGDRFEEWRRVAGRTVVHVGPDGADGDTMLKEPHVRALAALLGASLRHDEQGEVACG